MHPTKRKTPTTTDRMEPRYDRFLSIGATKVLHLFFEILVLIHHLQPNYAPFHTRMIVALGPIAVAGFLFTSGYGIGVKLRDQGDPYRHRLLTCRAPTMYLRLVLTDLFYLIPFFLLGNHFSGALSAISSVLYLPFFPQFVALSRWVYFIADLLVYYLVIALFATIFRRRKNGYYLTLIAFLVALITLVVVLSVINLKTGSSRYMRGAFLFPLGYAIAGVEKKVFERRVTPTIKWITCAGLLAVGVGIFLLTENSFVCEYLMPIPFVLAAAIALLGCDPKGRVLDYFSGLVLGVYLSHEGYFRIFCHFLPSVDPWLRMLYVILCALATAALIDGIKRAIRLLAKRRRQAQI